MRKTFLQNLGFAAIAVGFMAISMDSAFAQQGNPEGNLENCLKTLKTCVNELTADQSIPFGSRGEQLKNRATGCITSYDGCIRSL